MSENTGVVVSNEVVVALMGAFSKQLDAQVTIAKMVIEADVALTKLLVEGLERSLDKVIPVAMAISAGEKEAALARTNVEMAKLQLERDKFEANEKRMAVRVTTDEPVLKAAAKAAAG